MSNIRWRPRIQIKSDGCRLAYGRRPVQESMELQVRQVRRPNQRCQAVHHAIMDFAAFFARYVRCLYPRWPMRWTLPFVKEKAFHAFRISFERDGPGL